MEDINLVAKVNLLGEAMVYLKDGKGFFLKIEKDFSHPQQFDLGIFSNAKLGEEFEINIRRKR